MDKESIDRLARIETKLDTHLTESEKLTNKVTKNSDDIIEIQTNLKWSKFIGGSIVSVIIGWLKFK